jgi:hypothetical protein
MQRVGCAEMQYRKLQRLAGGIAAQQERQGLDVNFFFEGILKGHVPVGAILGLAHHLQLQRPAGRAGAPGNAQVRYAMRIEGAVLFLERKHEARAVGACKRPRGRVLLRVCGEGKCQAVVDVQVEMAYAPARTRGMRGDPAEIHVRFAAGGHGRRFPRDSHLPVGAAGEQGIAGIVGIHGKIGQGFAPDGFGVAVQNGMQAHAGNGDLGAGRGNLSCKKQEGKEKVRDSTHDSGLLEHVGDFLPEPKTRAFCVSFCVFEGA